MVWKTNFDRVLHDHVTPTAVRQGAPNAAAPLPLGPLVPPAPSGPGAGAAAPQPPLPLGTGLAEALPGGGGGPAAGGRAAGRAAGGVAAQQPPITNVRVSPDAEVRHSPAAAR